MSISLMKMVWDIQFPTQSQLLLALKLADHSDDNGQSIFPARGTLAKSCQCTLSTIDLGLSLLKKIGLLKVVQQGGTAERPWSSTEYAFDMDLLKRLSDGDAMLQGTARDLEIVDVNMSSADSTPPSDGSEATPMTGRRESIIDNHHHFVPNGARRAEQGKEALRRKKSPPPPSSVLKTLFAPRIDRLRERAEGFGVDVDDIMESIRRTKPRDPVAYMETICVNRLKGVGAMPAMNPEGADKLIRAALRGGVEQTKILFRMLTSDLAEG